MSNGVICTGNGVTLFQLLAVKSAIKLESVGLKHSGGSVRKRWAAQLGLKPRAPHADFITALEKKIAELKVVPGVDVQAL